MSLGRCKKCGATVRWSKTVNGAPIPLDVRPIQVAQGDPEEEVFVRVAYGLHQVTCPGRVKVSA